MKKYLFKVSFIMRAFILGKEHKEQGTKHILIEAESYDAATKILHRGMKHAYCSYQVESDRKENEKIHRFYNAMDNFSSALDEVCNLWSELDEHIPAEEKLVDHLNKYFPKDAMPLSLDDFACEVREWNRKVQGITTKN